MRLKPALLLVLTLLAAPAGAYPRAAADPATGLWMNPYRSVAVQNMMCGTTLCGRVVWASNEAKADARESGVSELIGLDLLEDYRPQARGNWKGTVLVPDLGRRFSSTIETIGPDHLKISGCVLHGLVCKSQIWTRIGALPQ